MNPAEEQNVLEAIRLNDRQAFEKIFRDSYKLLKAYAFRFVNDLATAENMVQDVFLKLWQNRHNLVITTSLVHYLFRSVRNHSLNHLEKTRVRTGYLRMQLEKPRMRGYSAFYPEIGYSKKLNCLSVPFLPKDRKFSGLPVKRVEIPRNRRPTEPFGKTVKAQMTLALKQLRESLKEYHYLVLFLSFRVGVFR